MAKHEFGIMDRTPVSKERYDCYEPEKYKNFRFVAGCEFMFLDENSGFKYPAFEAVGLGINPFCEELLEKLGKFNPINIINSKKRTYKILPIVIMRANYHIK